MAKWYDSHAKFGRMNFEREMQLLLTRETHGICLRRGWRLHGIGNEDTHLHALVSWKEFIESGVVVGQLKGALSHHLGKVIGPTGRKWFSRGASEKRVLDRAHFSYLVETYFPSHSGVFWKEVGTAVSREIFNSRAARGSLELRTVFDRATIRGLKPCG